MSGCGYGSSQALVFFSFIVPFLEDAIVKNLSETLETCRSRGLMPEEPYIRETAMLLDGYLIDPIYRYMADIDRRIRGKGYPKNVKRKDVTDEITEMVKFLDKSKDEMIRGINDLAKVSILELIKQGESHTLEFKEIPECNTQQNQKNNDVLFPSLKAIAGFLNATGGTLFIGVDDSGKLRGIDEYLNTMKRGNNDTFEQKIRNCLRDHFEPQPIGKVNVSFEKLTEGTICRIDVQASKEPVHLNNNLNNKVYVREGNTTQPLEGRQLTDWIKQRIQASEHR